jgi:Transglycosylase-like domain
MRRLRLVVAALCVSLPALTAGVEATVSDAALRAEMSAAGRAQMKRDIRVIDHARGRVRYWRRVMGLRRPRPAVSLRELRRTTSTVTAHQRAHWKRRARAARRHGKHPPHLAGWRCIRRHETGSPFPGWRTRTGNGYYGGLQMDRSFQRTYGRWIYRSKGTANHWTKWEQIWTAEKARRSGRGFYPWPNSARVCGLI